MTSNPTEGLVEALRAPSYQQDSAWHVAPFNYVTKPKALLSEAADRIEALEGERDREEIAHRQTLDDRDAAEEALSQAYFLILGSSPPWSSVFGRTDALEEIDEAQHALRSSLTASQARISELERDEGASNAISSPTPKSADTGAGLSAVCPTCGRGA